LALPSAALAKPAIDHSLFGQHLSEFDEKDAIISTVQRAFGTLWYGNCKPEFIMAPYRVTGRVWNAIMPRQRFPVQCNRSRYGKGFMFCGATWFGNDSLTDEVVLMNTRWDSIYTPDIWKKFNGWYRASRMILEDPYGDECYERMLRS
jgi:hypothetical protein